MATTECLDCQELSKVFTDIELDIKAPEEDKLKVQLDVGDLVDGALQAITRDRRELLEWKGNKVLDKLLEATSENLRAQYDSGRIQGKEYAEVYAQSIVAVIDQAVRFVTTRAQLEIQLKSQWEIELAKLKVQLKQLEIQLAVNMAETKIKCCKTKAEIKQTISQTRVLDRQLVGFDDNMYIKLLEYQMNAFSMIYSSGMLDDATLPAPLNITELGDLYTVYKRRIEKNLPTLLDEETAEKQSGLYTSTP